ncbi:MAG: hypothetical protein LBC02_13605 [Planctomycetaceae bacterium]|nr:hypothetical protein [Planctomycetaceae bacterium]
MSAVCFFLSPALARLIQKKEEEHRVESFQTLLSSLATICKNECRIESKKDISFNTFTSPNAFQEELLNKIKPIKEKNKPK